MRMIKFTLLTISMICLLPLAICEWKKVELTYHPIDMIHKELSTGYEAPFHIKVPNKLTEKERDFLSHFLELFSQVNNRGDYLNKLDPQELEKAEINIGKKGIIYSRPYKQDNTTTRNDSLASFYSTLLIEEEMSQNVLICVHKLYKDVSFTYDSTNSKLVGKDIHATVLQFKDKEEYGKIKICRTDIEITLRDEIVFIDFELDLSSKECNLHLNSQKTFFSTSHNDADFLFVFLIPAMLAPWWSGAFIINYAASKKILKARNISVASFALTFIFESLLYYPLCSFGLRIVNRWSLYFWLTVFVIGICFEIPRRFISLYPFFDEKTAKRWKIGHLLATLGWVWALSKVGENPPNWFLMITSTFLLPQIIKAFREGYSLSYNQIIGLTAPKIFYISYYKIYLPNINLREPDYEFVLKYTAVLVAQIAILAIQSKLIPLNIIGYNYLQKITSEVAKTNECPLCYNLLSDPYNPTPPMEKETARKQREATKSQLDSDDETEKSQLVRRKVNDIKEDISKVNEKSLGAGQNTKDDGEKKLVMVTPCNHYFHTECLREHLDFEQKCPAEKCNKPIPEWNEKME